MSRVVVVATGRKGPKGDPGEDGADGGVTSVNGETGVVVLTAVEVGADPAGTAAGAVAVHSAHTTNQHGIADTALLLTTSTKLDDLATPDDNTDLNASSSRHGLLRKLSGTGTEFLNGLGTWSTPAGGGGGGGGDLLAANNLSELTSASTARTNLGLGTAATTAASAYEVAGAAAAAQAAAIAASQPLDSDLTALAALSTTSFGRALLAMADAAATRTALGLGTAATSASAAFDPAGSAAAAQAASQPLESDLTAVAALTTTAYGRAFLELANAAAARTAIGAVIGTDVAAQIHTHAAVDIVSGTIATARLGSGTADSSTYLRGDQTWATASAVVALDDLSDVDTTGVSTGEVLTFDGANYVMDAVTLDLNSATTATPTTSDFVVGTDVSAANANVKFLISDVVGLASGGGATNLSYTAAPTNGIVASNTGTDATLSLAGGTNAGLMAPADFTKLATAYVPSGTDVAVADGGTGSSTAAGARTNLGLVIGTDVAAATAVARANHTGSQLAATISDLSTAAYVPGGTDVPVADGGTGASTAAGARTNLGLVIGTDVAAATAVARANHTGTQLAATISDLGTAATTAATDYATAAQGATADAAVPKSLYDAHTVLFATTDDTPAALTVAASTFVGRKASGNISAMSTTEARALLNVADAAIAGIRVEDEGTSTVAVATGINFAGAGVTVTDAGSNEALVTIAGGGSSDPLDGNNIVATRMFAR